MVLKNSLHFLRKISYQIAFLFLSSLLFFSCEKKELSDEDVYPEDNNQDMMTPVYYIADNNDPFKMEINQFIEIVREEQFHHPLESESGQIPDYSTPAYGYFGAVKGVNNVAQYHPAFDMHVGNKETDVNVYAVHDGEVATFRDADKYRHYISVAKNITDNEGKVVGKLVTIYGHVDLDLDENESMFLNGQQVGKCDLLSQNLYSGTVGGPHLHFEIRYNRKDDVGDETFYGSKMPNGNPDLTEPSAGTWEYGFWNPNVGYGFGHLKSHGL